MAADRSQNLQDTFLNHVRKNKTPLTIFLVNGVKLQGVVTWFDNRNDRLSPPDSGQTGRALVIEPHLRSRESGAAAARGKAALRSPEARLEEAVGLARAIDLNVVASGIAPLWHSPGQLHR